MGNSMSDIMHKYRVIKSESGLFSVDFDDEIIFCKARSKNKKDSILVGDLVSLESGNGEYVITDVSKRKNVLVRPAIANIDQIIALIAVIPEADFLLIDRLIINCLKQKIDIVLCVNKIDFGKELYDKLCGLYGGIVDKIIYASAIKDEVEEIGKILKGKVTCLAGQSAVGKSTVLNSILGEERQRIGELSRKVSRGKNTTTSSEIFKTHGGYIIDTPGFNLLDLHGIEAQEVRLYYSDFLTYADKCKFSTCTHTTEPLCAVRDAVSNGKIDEQRYLRYLKIYSEQKEKEKNEY